MFHNYILTSLCENNWLLGINFFLFHFAVSIFGFTFQDFFSPHCNTPWEFVVCLSHTELTILTRVTESNASICSHVHETKADGEKNDVNSRLLSRQTETPSAAWNYNLITEKIRKITKICKDNEKGAENKKKVREYTGK